MQFDNVHRLPINGKDSQKGYIWLANKDHVTRGALEGALKQAGLKIIYFEAIESVIQQLSKKESPIAILLNIHDFALEQLSLVQNIHKLSSKLPIIVMTTAVDIDIVVAAFQAGAFDVIQKPFDTDEIAAILKRAVKYSSTNFVKQDKEIPKSSSYLVGADAVMQQLIKTIGRLSNTSINVLVTGESGTGKELIAHALHRHSPRSRQPFIALNAAAIPHSLLESELFGHEQGAFTGAIKRHIGYFEQANHATIFLDEIGDMPIELQAKLLRVLSYGEFFRVGGHRSIKTDVRMIAATHQDLEQRVKKGTFRADLYHRLNVIHLHIPPLRERRKDILPLATHFLNNAALEFKTKPKSLHVSVVNYFIAYDWPGNVRQLENVCRWLTVMTPMPEIYIEDLPPELCAGNNNISQNNQPFQGVSCLSS